MDETSKICTFFVNNYFFGIDVIKVQEVIRYQEMTQIPLADETISGLINLRGQIVMSLDMRKRLGFPAMQTELKPTNVIIRMNEGVVSLLVDDIGDVIDIPRNAFESPPENLKGSIRSMLKEVCKLEDKFLLILNIEQVFGVGQEESESITGLRHE